MRKGRKGTTERVSGMGDIKWTSAGGDGAVEIPKDWHIALPVPDKLAKEPGHPYSIEMRFRLSALNDWQPLLNMPADNASDALVYVNKGDSRLAIKQHNKAGGSAVYGESGFVVGKDHTLVLNFGANKTTAFLDGKQVFTRECTLAGSYADCSKAGGYFLIRGDEDGEGGTVTFYEVKVYDGAVGATTPAENAGGAENKTPPSNTTSPSPVATPTANNPTSPVATPTANNPASPAGGNNGQTGEPSAEVLQTLTTFSEDNGLSAAEKIPPPRRFPRSRSTSRRTSTSRASRNLSTFSKSSPKRRTTRKLSSGWRKSERNSPTRKRAATNWGTPRNRGTLAATSHREPIHLLSLRMAKSRPTSNQPTTAISPRRRRRPIREIRPRPIRPPRPIPQAARTVVKRLVALVAVLATSLSKAAERCPGMILRGTCRRRKKTKALAQLLRRLKCQMN